MNVWDIYAGTGSATAAFRSGGASVHTFDINTQFDVTEHLDITKVDVHYLIDKYGIPDFVWASPPCTTLSVGGVGSHWFVFANCKRLRCGGRVTPVRNPQQQGTYHALTAGTATTSTAATYQAPRIALNRPMRYWRCSVETCQRRIPPYPDELNYEPKSKQAKDNLELLTHLGRMLGQLQKIQQKRPFQYVIENPVGLMRKLPQIAALTQAPGVEMQTVTYCQYTDGKRKAQRQKPTDLFMHIAKPELFVAKTCKKGADCHEAAPRGSRAGTQALDPVEAAKIPYGLSEAVYKAVI